jgi:hypothetical protein
VSVSFRTVAVSSVVVVAIAACGGSEPPPKPPAPPQAPTDPQWLGGVASACAKIASCTYAHDAPRLRDPGACVDWFAGHFDAAANARDVDPLQRCVESAKGCEQVNACVHGAGDPRAVEFCSKRPGVVSGCDGDRLVSCGDDSAAESSVVDCAKLGATCRETKSTGGLVMRACVSPQKCPPGAPEARCDGNAVLSCRDGAMDRVACKPGTQCEERKDESGESLATCELPGRRRCDLLGSRRCEDDRLVECERGAGSAAGKARVSDCAGLGLRCLGVGPRAGCYVPSNVECDKELLPRCDAGKVVFCAAGRVTKIACASLGLGACKEAARGPLAACEDTTPATPIGPFAPAK